MAARNKGVVGLDDAPPRQPCEFCGAPLLMTRESLRRLQSMPKGRVCDRGLFFTCECSDDLQPIAKATWDAVISN